MPNASPTDCEHTESELKRLQAENQLILDAAGEGIYGLNCQGETTFLNAAAVDILGWQEQDILGKPIHDIHHHSHADGSHYPREQCPIYAALKDGEVHRVDHEVFWHSNGHAIPVEYTSTPIWQDGRLAGAVVVFRDISRRKQMEHQRQQDFNEINSLKEQLEQERDYLRDELNITIHYGEIIGESQALKRTLAQIEAVAKTPTSTLILGESGVGKEMIARAIHCNSERHTKPLVKVNCASIPKDLFESEFFGHVKGAFTGAHRDRVGRMALAHGGSLFLDEVGEIPLDLQGKLLRALQEQEFERVGDEKTLKVDVRIIAATNKDLLEEVKAGRFREDLYYRLSVFPIEVPPLRERQSDIAPLAQHFLHCICKEQGRDVLSVSKSQAHKLTQHRWPGNIRELKNVMERAVIMSPGQRLQLDLAMPSILAVDNSQHSPSLSHAQGNQGHMNSSPSNGDGQPFSDSTDDYKTDLELRALEKQNLLKVLALTHWRISGTDGAAELLGLKPSTLAYKIKSLGLEKPR
ncbi:MAG: Fis family transcriptional regulator [Gammaproteobacteria bacterium]|nr:MAG: Fis family transcriptional regulator [Gammaproteobacteria bacterium]